MRSDNLIVSDKDKYMDCTHIRNDVFGQDPQLLRVLTKLEAWVINGLILRYTQLRNIIISRSNRWIF